MKLVLSSSLLPARSSCLTSVSKYGVRATCANIINANDFGYAQGVNHGVISAYEQELMLSTNLKDKKRQSYS